jgi:hypothetical protein
MAAQGTVEIYYRTTEQHRHPVEGIPGFWHASYSYLDRETVTVRFQPYVGFQASDKQLTYHADQALRAKMRQSGEPYAPSTYRIAR